MSILPKKQTGATITAAAKPLNIRNTTEAAQISAVTRTKEQREAWRFYGSMSELNYPTNYLGRNVARFRFPVGVIPADDLMAAPSIPDVTERDPLYKLAERLAFMIRSEDGGISDLAEAYTKNMAVAGEGWLVGRKVSGENLLTIFSVSEFGPKGNGDSWQGASDQGVAYARYTTGNPAKPDADYKFNVVRRVWQPNPELREYADTTTFAVLGNLRTLEILDRSLRARIVNTLTQSGFLIMPTQFHLAGPVGAPKGDGNAIDDPFAAKLLDIIQRQHDSGNASAMPSVIRGDAQYAEAVRFLTMDRTIDRVELELRAENRSAVAKGMFLPPEVVEGMGSANHFSAWSVADSAYSHLLPFAQGFANMMTTTVLWPWLREGVRDLGLSGVTEADIRRHVLLPDGSDVITRPNEAEDGRQLHDRMVISDRALRDRSGVPEGDAPSEEEYVRLEGRKINNPYLATYGMDIHDKIDWDAVAAVGQAEGRPGVGSIDEGHRPADSSDPAGAPGEGDAGEDDDLSARLLAAAAPGYLLSARKKVGAKLRARCEPNKELHAAIKSVPNEDVLLHIDPETDLDLARGKVEDWFIDELSTMHEALPDMNPVLILKFARAAAIAEVESRLDPPDLLALAATVTLPAGR